MLQTVGKIAGGLGLLFFGTSWITLLLTGGSAVAFAVKLSLGVALLVLWAFTNGEKLSSFAKGAFFYSSSFVSMALVVAIVAAANAAVAKRNHTWDLTSNRIFSLSPQTVSVLKELKEPVRAIGFVSPPPDSAEQLLARYRSETQLLHVEFRDPRKDPEAAAKYELREGQRVLVLSTGEKDKERHVKVSLDRLASPALGEQELTNGLQKLGSSGTQRLYFVQGHDELPLEAAGQAEFPAGANLTILRRLLEDEGYDVRPVNLIERGEVPPDAAALVFAGPRSRLHERELFLVEDYLAQGGRVLYFSEATGPTGAESLLAKYGVELRPGLVADAKLQPDDPYVVLSPFFGEHELVRRLADAKATAVLPTVRALAQLREGLAEGVTVTPLVLSSPYAWIEAVPSEAPQLDSGEVAGQLPLAMAATRSTASAPKKRFDEARLVVFGDADCLAPALAYNRNLVMNAFAWASEQGQKITIRPPDRDLSTLDVTPERFATLRLLTLDVLPMFLMAVGLTLWLTRRAR